jgi:hypothetical protein
VASRNQWAMLRGEPMLGALVVCLITWQYTSLRSFGRSKQACVLELRRREGRSGKLRGGGGGEGVQRVKEGEERDGRGVHTCTMFLMSSTGLPGLPWRGTTRMGSAGHSEAEILRASSCSVPYWRWDPGTTVSPYCSGSSGLRRGSAEYVRTFRQHQFMG